MKVFLDDERTSPRDYLIAKTAKEAIKYLKTNNVTDISLDHDLGDDSKGTGYTVLLWIEKQIHTNPKFKLPNIKIHTANPSARTKMELALKSIKKYYTNENKTNYIKLKDIIDESPDRVQKASINFAYDDAYPFGYDKQNHIRVGKSGEVHGQIYKQYSDKDININTYDRDDFKFAGRIWIKKKIISFWKYPRKTQVPKVFDDVKKEMKIQNGINIGSIERYKIDLANDTLIPLTKFLKLAGSQKQKRDPKQLQLKHMLSPIAKTGDDVPSGVGSKKYPAGLTYTQYAQLLHTSENKMKTIKLKSFIKEDINDSKVLGMAIYNNMKKLKKLGGPISVVVKGRPGANTATMIFYAVYSPSEKKYYNNLSGAASDALLLSFDATLNAKKQIWKLNNIHDKSFKLFNVNLKSIMTDNELNVQLDKFFKQVK